MLLLFDQPFQPAAQLQRRLAFEGFPQGGQRRFTQLLQLQRRAVTQLELVAGKIREQLRQAFLVRDRNRVQALTQIGNGM